jgi:hypothetical protein
MRFKILCMLGVGCGILGIACWTIRGPMSHRLPPVPPPDPKNGYISTRWIGLQSSSGRTCPRVAGWTGEPLLEPRLARDALIRELGLDRFCVYTPKAGSNRPFVAPPGLEAKRDRLAISSSSSSADVVKGSLLTSNSDAVNAALAQEFLSQTGPLSSPLPGPPNVQITFVTSG